MKYTICALIFLLSATSVIAQKSSYTYQSIADSLKHDANAVVRLDQTDLNILSQRDMKINTTRIVTVLNEKGLRAIGATVYYDGRRNVKSIEATVYDGLGLEIKKIRRKDFRDQSTISGSTLFSDSRVIFLDYTPIQYPFTIVYECEVSSSNTAFLETWLPLDRYYVSVEKSILNVTVPENLGFKKKEINFSKFPIKKITESLTQLSYVANNIPAQKEEYYSMDFEDIFPSVKMGLEAFHLEGVDGTAKSWKEFGQWYSDKILSGTTELPQETKTKIIALVGNEKDPIQKAKIIYNYVQQKSRYVSIQVGIGGWKPMLAKDVDRLGYGDCKALTNYTKALLEVVGVPAYSTILYGDENRKKSIDADFVSMQGNHMMLALPNGNEYIWLECTSQEDPFGFQANFTDDRDVLVVKPDGGVIVRTKNYQEISNLQQSAGSYTIAGNGDFTGTVNILSEGTQYRSKYRLESTSPTDQEAHYKECWSNINNLKINMTRFDNDKEKVSFIEDLSLGAINYGVVTGDKMMVTINAYNQFDGNIKRIRNRRTPFQISRGFYDTDEIIVNLPQGFLVETAPKDFELSSKFGTYKTAIVKKDDASLVYKRSLLLKKGAYLNTEYEDFRLFMEQIARNDNSKLILAKIH